MAHQITSSRLYLSRFVLLSEKPIFILALGLGNGLGFG